MVRSLHICGIRLESLNGRIVVLSLEIRTIYLIGGNPKAQLSTEYHSGSVIHRLIQFVATTISFQTNHFLVFPTFGGTWCKHLLLRPSRTGDCMEEWPGPIHGGTKPEFTVLVATVHSRGSEWTQRCLHPFSGRCLSK